jgi:hypothetical protein
VRQEAEKWQRKTLTEWMRVVSTGDQEREVKKEVLALGHATLEGQKDKVGAATNAKFAE